MPARLTDRPATAHADPDRELIAAVRHELAGIEPARACCRTAERAGLGRAARGQARSPVVARLAVRLEGPPGLDFVWEAAADHCRVAYLRGLFLARGSLSVAAGRTHLEFVLPTGEGAVLVAQLGELGLPPALRRRRGRDVVTWKGAEPVMTFLRRIGGSSGVLELEARMVTRALRGHLNRVLNAEGANLTRSVATSTRQLATIEQLEASGELARLPSETRAVAQTRLEVPEASFTELAQRLGISRARVQRAFERLESLATTVDGARGAGAA